MLNYTKLWMLLDSKGMKKTDLKQIMSSATIAKLGKNEPISSTVIEKICGFLNCQPADIMEYVSEEDMRKTAEQLDNLSKAMAEQLQARGITEEQVITMMTQVAQEMAKGMFHGGTNMTKIYDKVIESNVPKNE